MRYTVPVSPKATPTNAAIKQGNLGWSRCLLPILSRIALCLKCLVLFVQIIHQGHARHLSSSFFKGML